MENIPRCVTEVKMPPSILKNIFKPILMITAVVYGIMVYYNIWMAIPFALVTSVVVWLMFFSGSSTYRYTLNKQELCINKVNKKNTVGKEKAIPVSEMELLVKSKSDRLNLYILKDQKPNMRDYTSRSNPEQEYVLVSKERDIITMSMLELDCDMVDAFRAVIFKKVQID